MVEQLLETLSFCLALSFGFAHLAAGFDARGYSATMQSSFAGFAAALTAKNEAGMLLYKGRGSMLALFAISRGA